METLRIDGEVVVIATLPDNLRNLATLYEHTLNKEIEARKDLAMVESAKADIGARITASYKQYKGQLENQQTQGTPDVDAETPAPQGD